MSRNNGTFKFSVENSTEKGVPVTEQQGGIGLTNVRRRLELLYPGKHELEIESNPDMYKVNFKLKI